MTTPVSGRELVRLWLRCLMPYEPSPWLVDHVLERLRSALNPDSRFPGDEPADWFEEEFGIECRILFDMLNVSRRRRDRRGFAIAPRERRETAGDVVTGGRWQARAKEEATWRGVLSDLYDDPEVNVAREVERVFTPDAPLFTDGEAAS